MPVYTPQTAESIHLYKVADCPFCSYTSPTMKYKSQMLSHIKKCKEHEQENDNIEDDECDDGEETVGYYLNWRFTIISVVKTFIRTNELLALHTQQPEQIRQYIKNKLLENIIPDGSVDFNKRLELDIFWIYTKFFEMNDEDNTKYDEVIQQYYESVSDWATHAD